MLRRAFVEAASQELIFAILMGLAYHEAAHQLSGEQDVKPHTLNNIICDSNDFNVVPRLWSGSIPFTLCLTNSWYKGETDLAKLPLATKTEKLNFLLLASIMYLRKLRIKFQGKDERTLPKEHILFDTVEKIKTIMKKARCIEVSKRPELVNQLHDVLKVFWREEQEQERADKSQISEDSLGSALEAMSAQVTEIKIQTGLTRQDVQELTKTNARFHILFAAQLMRCLVIC